MSKLNVSLNGQQIALIRVLLEQTMNDPMVDDTTRQIADDILKSVDKVLVNGAM